MVKSKDQKSVCLTDVECRAGEPNQDISFASPNVLCSYPLTLVNNQVKVSQNVLPPQWNVFEDNFKLHDYEYLLSYNGQYKMFIVRLNEPNMAGNLRIIKVNLILKQF